MVACVSSSVDDNDGKLPAAAAAQKQQEDEKETILRIDGSMGEGGGQLLRNAISFATLLNKPMHVSNIRAGRSKPGLKAQHVASLQLPVEIMCCGGNDEKDNNSNSNNQAESTDKEQEQIVVEATSEKEDDVSNDVPHKRQKQLRNDSGSCSCSPYLTGDTLHSCEIHFQPPPSSSSASATLPQSTDSNHEQQRTIVKDIGTAGSICLLLQAALPCAIYTSMKSSRQTTIHLILRGGTNATLAPQYDYWTHVFLPTLQEQCGFFNNAAPADITGRCSLRLPTISAHMIRRGYYPRGGGEVCITIQPPPPPPPGAGAGADSTMTATKDSSNDKMDASACLHPIQLTERGEVKQIYIRSFHAGRLPRHLAETMARAAKKLLRKTFPASSHGGRARQQQHENKQQGSGAVVVEFVVDIVTEPNAVGSGLGILVVATTTTGCRLAGSALSEPKKQAADVGRAAAQELLDTLKDGGCVDEWLQDQLILYMALAKGVSEVKTGSLTLHTRTAIEVAQIFCGSKCFEIHKLDNDSTNEDNNTRSSCDPKTKRTINGDDDYGLKDRIPGQHLIRCHGIGHSVAPL